MDDTSSLLELKTERFGKTKIFDVEFENADWTYVRDDYDDIWSDFGDDDISIALKHARQELKQAKQELEQTKPNAISAKKHLKRVCKDLENYLVAASELVREDLVIPSFAAREDKTEKYCMWDRNAVKLISSLASFEDRDVDEWVTEVIRRRCKQDNGYELNECFLPDYRELYESLGDSSLFYCGDVHRAILWYELMTIDWERLDNENDEELEDDEKKIKQQNTWWRTFIQNVENVQRLSHEDFAHTDLTFANVLDMSESCNVKFNAFLSAWASYQTGLDTDSAQNIWSTATDYYNDVKLELLNADEHSDVAIKRRLQTEVALARIIKNLAKYYCLVSVANKENDLTGNQENDVKEILKSGDLYLPKAKPVETYLRTKRDSNGDLSRDCLQKSLNLIKAISLCDKILYVLNQGIFSGRVAYYTSIKTLKKSLPETADCPENIGKFAVMHVAYMNDPNEGRVLERIVFDQQIEKNQFGRTKAEYPYVFIKCFTTRIDDLPMWEMYGDHARGCCIVIDMGKIMKSEQIIFPVYNVCYLKKNETGSFRIRKMDNATINSDGVSIIKKILPELKKIRCSGAKDKDFQVELQNVLSRITYLFKNADYSHEQEKRIIYYGDLKDGIVIRQTIPKSNDESPLLYVLSETHIHIDEIILGPKIQDASWEIPYLQKSIDEMKKGIGDYNPTVISYSDIEYR